MGVNGAHKLALELERHVPDKTHQHLGCVVVAQHQGPQGANKRGAQFVLLKLPDHGLGAVSDEDVAKRLRFAQQAPAQQRQLAMEGLNRFGLLQGIDLRARGVERAACAEVAAKLVAAGWAQLVGVHRMISASQLAATRLMRLLSSGVTLMRSMAPAINWPTSRDSPLTTMRVFSNSSGRSW